MAIYLDVDPGAFASLASAARESALSMEEMMHALARLQLVLGPLPARASKPQIEPALAGDERVIVLE